MQPKIKTVKTYADTFLYSKYRDYDKMLFKTLMSCEIIDKNSDEFQEAMHEIKRRAVSFAFLQCMTSDNVVFIDSPTLPRVFDVFTAKDVKKRATTEMAINDASAKGFTEEAMKKVADIKAADGTTPVKSGKDNKKTETPKKLIEDLNPIPFTKPMLMREEVSTKAPLKVFVNVRPFAKMKGNIIMYDPELLIASLMEVFANLLYYKMPDRIINSPIRSYGAFAFAKLFTNIVDYIGKISVMGNMKDKVEYASYLYFLSNQLGMEINKTYQMAAIKASRLTEREAAVVDAYVNAEAFTNIRTFTESISDMTKLPDLTTDMVVEKWMWLYGGNKTGLALEYFPAFSGMLTDTYSGTYKINQKTIDKIAGQTMVEYTKALIARVESD